MIVLTHGCGYLPSWINIAKEDEEWTMEDSGTDLYLEIEYCPMCGIKLSEDK